jgi:hypothetical protein
MISHVWFLKLYFERLSICFYAEIAWKQTKDGEGWKVSEYITHLYIKTYIKGEILHADSIHICQYDARVIIQKKSISEELLVSSFITYLMALWK